MKVTPLDLKKADFKRAIRGYDVGDVDELMAAAAETMEDMVRENRELKDKVTNLGERLKSYESMEHTLNETLITAQKAGDSTRQAAERESELIIAKAEVQAEKLVEEAKSELKQIRYQIEMLEHEREAYLVKMRSLVASQWKLLQEDMEIKKPAAAKTPEPEAKPAMAPEPEEEVGAAEAEELQAEDMQPLDEGEDAPDEEQDYGNLSDKLGKILGDSGEDGEDVVEDLGEADLGDSDSLALSDEDAPAGEVDLEDLPQEAGGDDEKPEVFWGDDQPEDEAGEDKAK